jgi:hypothetical protein
MTRSSPGDEGPVSCLNVLLTLRRTRIGYDARVIGGFMIRKFVLLSIPLAMLTVVCFCGAQSQKPVLDSANTTAESSVQLDRTNIIDEAMDLSPRDAASFWPIYREYERERSALCDRRIAIVKEYNEKYLSMSDNDAKAMAKQMFEYDSQVMELNRKYFNKLNKVLPTYTVAKFFQVEHRIDLMMEMKVEPSLPPLPQLN